MLAAVLLQKSDGSHGAAAGGQHGIHDEHFPLVNVLGQLAVILHRLVGLRVPEQADVAHLGRGNQVDHGVHHAQTRPENGDNGQLLTGQHLNPGLGHGGFDLHLLGGKVPGGLIAHKGGDFAHQLPELLDRGVLAPQNRQLVLDERMVQYVYATHIQFPFWFVDWSRSSRSRSAWDRRR